jgi:murein DD-endopeptidase MepM/ murein hydrolase activator NlpD
MPQKPVKDGYITSEYGPRELNGKKEFHPGLDIGSKSDQPGIYCAISGTVVASGWSDSFGNRVWICCGSNLYVVYGHMAKINDDIKIGLKINEGNPIGIMGSTGHSFGRHLHYEHRTLLNIKGSHINPEIIRKLYI